MDPAAIASAASAIAARAAAASAPDPALVRRAAAFLERAGFLRAVAGDPDHLALATAYASLHAGAPLGRRGLLLIGPVGVGKTHAALSIARAQGPNHPVLLDPADEYGADRASNAATLDSLSSLARSGTWIVLDDLGRGDVRLTYGNADDPWQRLLFRWAALPPSAAPYLIVTTNMTPSELNARYGAATLSRLLGRLVPCRLTGPDKRVTGAPAPADPPPTLPAL